MPRVADDILIGGMRLFIVEDNNGTKEYYDLGWLSGEFRYNRTGDTTTVKESEGQTVLVIATNVEEHFTFSMLECNTDTLLKLNPSATPIGGAGDTTSDGKGFATGTFQSDETFMFEAWMKKRSGQYHCIRIFNAKVSGDFTMFLMNQDDASPIDIDIIAIADKNRPTNHNLSEQFDCDASKAPGGGW